MKIGDTIRLQHHATRCHLHSHLHKAPLTNTAQEVSCFPNQNDDDDWVITSTSGETGPWKRGDSVAFRHRTTQKYLVMTDKKFGNPIPGQYETAAVSSAGRALFRTAEGFYFPKKK